MDVLIVGSNPSLALFFHFFSQKEQNIEQKYDEGGVEFCQLSSKNQPTLVVRVEATLKNFHMAPYKNLGRFYRVPFKSLLRVQIKRASVLERIWVKGSYLSQWLPQGERGPPKESKSQWIEILHVGSQEQFFFSKFFLD